MAERFKYPPGCGSVTQSGDRDKENKVREAIIAGAEWMHAARLAGFTKPAIVLNQDGTADMHPDLLAASLTVFQREPTPHIVSGVIQHLAIIQTVGWERYTQCLAESNKKRMGRARR